MLVVVMMCLSCSLTEPVFKSDLYFRWLEAAQVKVIMRLHFTTIITAGAESD